MIPFRTSAPAHLRRHLWQNVATGQIVGIKIRRPRVRLRLGSGPAPISLVRRPCHARPMQRPTLAIPRLSLRVALLIALAIVAVVAWVHFRMGRAPICPCGFKLWHGGRGDAEVSQHLTRLVHLQPRPARLYLLLAAVGRLARPSVGGGAAADRRPDRGGLGAPRELALRDRALSRAHDLARLQPATASSIPSATCWRCWRASCWRRGCRPG